MKRLGKLVLLVGMLIILVLVATNPAWGAPGSAALEPAEPVGSGMPGWPLPDKAVPQHEPGRASRAGNYSTQVTQINAAGEEESVSLTGLDAMLADGVIDDPLAGNYTLVSKDDIAFGVFNSTYHSIFLKTYENITVTLVADSETSLAAGLIQSLDITAGDLNGDGVDEQIAAWVEVATGHIMLAIGEMPGTDGRSSSEPAAAADGENIDLLVRGYDQALWHAHYNGSTWGDWDNDGGGLMLSGPAMASRGSADFDIFAVGTDNQIHQNNWNGSDWSGWSDAITDIVMTTIPAWIGPPPELPAPAAVASGTDEFDIFRVAPDNTLRWNHFDGSTWGSWQGLGGMLASGPGAVLLNDGRLQVFAVGVDQALWYLRSEGAGWEMQGSTYKWQRVALDGMNPEVVIVSAPTPVVTNGDIRVYALGSDNALWQVTYDGTWGNWSEGGGDLASRPAAAGSDLFALAPDGRMLHSSDEGNSWGDFANPWLPACCLGTPINTGIQAYVTEDPDVVDQINLLDIETGHFLGDGRQQIALAYTWEDAEEAGRTGVGLRLYDINDGFRTLEFLGEIDGSKYEEDYYPKIAVGEYDGDSPQEIALAYATRRGGVRVYTGENGTGREIAWMKPRRPDTTYADREDTDPDKGFWYFLWNEDVTPFYGSDMNDNIRSIKVAEGWQACVRDKWSLTFDCTDEDVDDLLDWGDWEYDDGISYIFVSKGDTVTTTISVDVTDGIYNQRNAYVALEIFDVDPQKPKPVSKAVDYYEMWFTDTDDYPAPERTLGIAAGDFDSTGNDEIALIWDKVCRGSLCENYRAYFHILDIDGSNISAHPYYDDEDEDEEKGDVEILKCMTNLYFEQDPYSAEINLTAGDFDGDGKDEIARTWPRASGDGSPGYHCFDEVVDPFFFTDVWPLLRRDLQVLDWDEGWSTSVPKEIDGAPAYNYKDAMAAGDLDLDLVDEIVYLNAHDDGDMLRTYSYTPTVGISPITGGVEPIPDLGTDVPVLAIGDFTGESLRVGPPTYRVQNRVDSLEALINMPPKHRDLVKDTNGDYQLVEVLTEPCWDTPADPRCSHAKHGGKEGEQSEIETKVERDWAIGAGLKSKFSYGYAFVDYSMEYSYGENFSKTETTINAQTFTQYATAYNHDKIVYYGMPYRVWEYPIYGDNTNEPLDYITVLFPVAEDMDGELYTPSPDTATGDFPGEPYYAPRHQTYNVWSYDPIGEVRFPDYEEENLILDKTISGGGDWFEVNSSQSSAIITTHTQAHDFSAEVGWGSKGSVSIMPFTSLKFSWKVRAHVKGSYAQNDIQTDKLTTTSETMLSVGISEQDNYLSFMIRPIAYWTEAGYLVLDYQTEMGDWGVWDDDGEYYNKPDPAFILPWYGFPDPDDPIPPASPALKLYSYDVQVSPVFASVGDTVTISATVRNFSNFPPDEAVIIRFFLGDPSDNIVIGEDSIPQLDRPDGPQTATITWTAAGVGKQKIYAVIDPQDNIEEVHDGDDLINNNIAYGRIQIGASDYGDMGLASDQAYQSLSYTQTNSLTVSAYFPPANLEEIVRFELKDATLAVGSVVGNPFEVVAYLGSLDWNAEEDFSLKPDGTPPAVIAIAYADADLAGFQEDLLTLYRYNGVGWQPANLDCGVNGLGVPLYPVLRLPQDGMLAVPICQTGTFVLSDQQPETQRFIYLPLSLK